MKITRRQLRRLIESVYVDPEGVAIDSATGAKKQFEQFDKIVDRLLRLLPADQSSKLSVLLKSDDPMNQNMGLELIDSLAMDSNNEEEILRLGNELRLYMDWFEIMDAGIDKPDSPIQYPELEAKWPKIKSALLQYALKAVKDNFNMLKDNAVNYASPTSPGYSQGWEVETTFDIIDLIKKYPKGASYVLTAELLGKDRVLKDNIIFNAIREPMDENRNDISSLFNQVTGKLYPPWLDNFTSSNSRGFVD